MTEELKIKVSIDTSQVKASIQQAQKSVEGITGKGNGAGAASKDVKGLSAEFDRLNNAIARITHIDMAGFIHSWNLKDTKKKLKEVREEIKKNKEIIKNAFKKDGFIRDDIEQLHGGIFKKQWLKDAIGTENIDDYLKTTFKYFKEDTHILGRNIKTVIGGSLKIIKIQLVGILAVLTAIGVALVGLAKNAMRVAKAMRRTHTEAHKIGMSVGSYQKWSYVMESVGGDAQDLTDFIRTLSSEQVKLREGNADTIKSFEKLGISAKKAANMSQQELFEETVRALANVENQVERTAMAYKIFGEEDAANLTNILALNNEQLERLEMNYAVLGGYASETLVARSDELDMSLRNLRTAWQGIKNVLAEAVLPAVNWFINGLVKCIAVVRMFLATIFNTDKKIAGSGVKTAANDMNKYSGAINGANKAVEKLRRITLGFDELNIVSNPKSGGASGGIGLNPNDYIPQIPDYGSIIPTVEDLGLDKFADFFERNKRAIEDWSTGILTSLGVIMALVGFATGNIPLGIAGIGLAGLGIWVGMGEDGTWQRWGQKIKDVANDVGRRFVEICEKGIAKGREIVQKAKNGIANIKEFFKESITGIKWFIRDVKDYLKNKVDECKNKVKQAFEPAADFFKEKAEAIKQAFKDIPKNFEKNWEEIKKSTKETAADVGRRFCNALDTIRNYWSGCREYFRDIKEGICEYFRSIPEYFGEKFRNAWSRIQQSFANFKTHFSGLKESLKYTFADVGDYLGSKFKGAWEKIKNTFSNWKSFFTGLWTTVKNIFTGIGSSIGSAIGGMIRGVINSILYKVENTVNYFIRMLNNALYYINKIPGVSISSLSTISIPKLATGGIATRSTLANIGENGREAVLPLENNTQWMDKLADKISSRSSSPSKIVLNVDGRELGWASIENINNITRQNGGIQLVL